MRLSLALRAAGAAFSLDELEVRVTGSVGNEVEGEDERTRGIEDLDLVMVDGRHRLELLHGHRVLGRLAVDRCRVQRRVQPRDACHKVADTEEQVGDQAEGDEAEGDGAQARSGTKHAVPQKGSENSSGRRKKTTRPPLLMSSPPGVMMSRTIDPIEPESTPPTATGRSAQRASAAPHEKGVLCAAPPVLVACTMRDGGAVGREGARAAEWRDAVAIR